MFFELALSFELLAGGVGHLVGGEAELGLQIVERRRGPEGVHADDRAVGADVAVPPQAGCLLDRDPGVDLGRQH